MPTEPQNLRIFISSPGDVAQERDKAKQAIAQLQKWYGSTVTLIPVLWEELPLEIDASFQEGIDVILSDRQGIDIAVFILWNRLGTTLGSITKPDGSPYLSGTEREFDLMLRAREANNGGRPEILFYRREDDETFASKLSDPANHEQLQDLITQRNLACSFLHENFWNQEGHNVRAYHSFHQPVEFAVRLKVHLRGLIDQHIEASTDQLRARWIDIPWRGLEVFNLEHAEIFFGRESETCELENRLRERAADENDGCAFVSVIGASGSGKSSLVRAGLRASLTRFNLDESVSEWRSVLMLSAQTNGQPLRGLVQSLIEEPGGLPELSHQNLSIDELTEALCESPDNTIKTVFRPSFGRASDQAGGPVKMLIIIDQFEELFTDKRISEEQREQFLNTIEALARSHLCWVVATMRSDFFPTAQLSKSFLRLKGERGHFDLLAPDAEALRRIITEPARMAGVRFEQRSTEDGGQNLVGQILQDARDQADVLPILSDLLYELYELRTDDNVITFEAYQSLGDENRTGLEGALSHRAEKEFAKLSNEQKAAFPDILHELVTVDAESSVRRRANLTAIRDTDAKAKLVDALVEARLLTAEGSEQGEASVCIAHEALIRKWDRIAEWVRENAQDLRLRSDLETDYTRWKEGGRHASLLLAKGLPLAGGVSLMERAPQLLSEEVRRYAKRSRNHHRGRQRLLVTVLATLMLMAFGAAGFAWYQTQEAKKGEIAAELAREDAEELVGFMLGDLREKLEALGKLELLEEVAEEVDQYFGEKDLGSVQSLRLRAKLLFQLAEIKRSRGQPVEANQLNNESINLYRQIMKTSAHAFDSDATRPDARLGFEILTSYHAMACNSWSQLPPQKRYGLLSEAIDLQPALDFAKPDSIEHIALLVMTLLEAADLQLDLKNQDAAKNLLREAGITSVTLGKSHPDNLRATLQETICRHRLAVSGFIPSEFEQSRFYRTNWDESIELLVKQAQNSGDPFSAKSEIIQHTLRNSMGLAALKRILELAESLNTHDPTNQRWELLLVRAVSAYAFQLQDEGYKNESPELAKRAIELGNKLIKKDPENVEYQRALMECHQAYGWCGGAHTYHGEGRHHFDEAFKLMRKLQELQPNNAWWYIQLANNRLKAGDPDAGVEYCRRARDIQSFERGSNVVIGDDAIDYLGTYEFALMALAKKRISEDQLEEAEQLIDELREIRGRWDNHYQCARGLELLSTIRFRQGRINQANEHSINSAKQYFEFPRHDDSRENQVRQFLLPLLDILNRSSPEAFHPYLDDIHHLLNSAESEFEDLDQNNVSYFSALRICFEVRTKLANCFLAAGEQQVGLEYLNDGCNLARKLMADRDSSRPEIDRIWGGSLRELCRVYLSSTEKTPQIVLSTLNEAERMIALGNAPKGILLFAAELSTAIGIKKIEEGNVENGILLLKNAVAARGSIVDLDPEQPNRLSDLAGALSQLALHQQQHGEYSEAIQSHLSAFRAFHERFNHPNTETPENVLKVLAERLNRYISLCTYFNDHDFETADQKLKGIARLIEESDASHRNYIPAVHSVSGSYHKLAEHFRMQSDLKQAARLNQEAILFALSRIPKVESPEKRDLIWKTAHHRLNNYTFLGIENWDADFLTQLIKEAPPLGQSHGGIGYSGRFVGKSFRILGQIRSREGDLHGAIGILKKCIAPATESFDRVKNEVWATKELVYSYRNLAELQRKTQLWQDAQASCLSGIAVAEEGIKGFPDNFDLHKEFAETLREQGQVLKEEKRLKESVTIYDRALKTFEKAIALRPEDQGSREAAAAILFFLGDESRTSNNLDKAESYYRRALTHREFVASKNQGKWQKKVEVARCYGKLADVLMNRDDTSKEVSELNATIVSILEPILKSGNLPKQYHALLERTKKDI